MPRLRDRDPASWGNVGTLVTDYLVDNFSVSLVTTTIGLVFALGTAAGVLVAERFGHGYLPTGILYCLIIASLALGYAFLGRDPRAFPRGLPGRSVASAAGLGMHGKELSQHDKPA